MYHWISGAALLLFVLSPAHADMTIVVTENGNDVELIGSGSLDLGGLSFVADGLLANPGIDPAIGFSYGSTKDLPRPVEVYLGEVLGPDSIGNGTKFVAATIGSGDVFGLGFGSIPTTIAVPEGYVSGTDMTGSMIFENTTLLFMGISPGEYVWTIGNNTIQMNVLGMLGDINLDGSVDLLDVAAFIELLENGGYQFEADINQDGTVNLLDVGPFIDLLSGD